ncbi:MAG: DUF2190 family protein [Candidatus Competibacter sp.]|jgi:predicted RecA/RadA family phage recombinase
MATNYIQTGETIAFTAPTGGVSSGDGVLVGNLFGVAVADYAEAAAGQFATRGVFTLPKLSTDALTEHQKVYWDATNKRVTETATGNYSIGVSVAVAGNGTTTCAVRLDGVSTVAAS